MTENEKADEKEKKQKAEKAAENVSLFSPFFITARKSIDDEVAPPPLWLLTFADITALMLTFFVLMYAMQTPDVEKWEEMTTALDTGFDEYKSAALAGGAQDTVDIEKLDLSRALPLDYLQSVIEDVSKDYEGLADMALFLQQDRLIISLPQNLLFESGKTEVSTEGKRGLFAIGGKLSHIRNRIEIIGHTDPSPISAAQQNFDSNRELSLQRALEVSAILSSVGYSRPITVRGMGSSRFEELSGKLDDESRLSLARRVDIVVLKDDGSSRSFLNTGDNP